MIPFVSLLFSFVSFVLIFPKTASAGGEEDRIVIEQADYMKNERDSRITTLRGSVRFTFRDTTVSADEAVIDEKGKNAVAKGNVKLSGPDGDFTGASLFYDYDKEWFELTEGAGSTTAADIKGRAYFTGSRIFGDRKKIKAYKVRFTTCGPKCPVEYHLRAKDVTVYPDNKIIARHAYLHLSGTRVLYFPVFVVSLKSENQYTPIFGFNKQEGFYIYNKYPYLAKAAITGWVLLDLMTRKGTRYGAEREYTSKRLGGKGYFLVKTNREKDTGSSTNLANITQQLTFGDKTKGNFSFSRNSTFNRYSGSSRVNTNTLSLNLARTVFRMDAGPIGPQRGRQLRATTLNFTRNASHTSKSDSNSDNLTATRRIDHSQRLNTTYSYNISSQSYTGRPANKDGRFKADTTYAGTNARMTLSLQRTYDLDGGSNPNDKAESLNVLWPRFNLALQPALYQRLIPQKYFPLNSVQFTHERIRQGPRNNSESLRRSTFLLGASKDLLTTPKFKFRMDQKFTQYLYSTKDAQYTMDHTSDATYSFTQYSRFNLNFNSVKDSGGSPYKYTGQRESIRLRSDFAINKPKTNFGLNTQYNYRAAPDKHYSPLSIKYSRATSQNSRFTLGGSHDINESRWGDTNTTMEIHRKNTTLKIGALWNTEDDFDLRKATLGMELKRNNGWNFKIQSVYEHKSRYSPIRDVVATKKRCCTEIEFRYNTVNEEFQFQYLILAFPSKKFGFSKGDRGFEIDQSVFQPPPGAGQPPPQPPQGTAPGE